MLSLSLIHISHDQRLARADLVVADAAPVLFEHPDTILLALVHICEICIIF